MYHPPPIKLGSKHNSLLIGVISFVLVSNRESLYIYYTIKASSEVFRLVNKSMFS